MLTSKCCACRFFRDLIDGAPCIDIHHMARGLLPPGVVWHADNGSDMQALLRQHCAVLAHLRSGNCKGVHRHELPDWSHQAIIRLIWSPGVYLVYLAIISEANGEGHDLSVIRMDALQPVLTEPVRLCVKGGARHSPRAAQSPSLRPRKC